MHRILKSTIAAVGIVLLVWLDGSAAEQPDAPSSRIYFDESTATTFFAFDDHSIPFSQNLKLVMNPPRKHAANPVVRRGAAGSPDSWAVQFYGSVIRDGERFRMWYVSAGDDRFDPTVPRSAPWRVAYAESRDGVHWVKPKLGLVEYNGSRDNNLVLLQPRLGVLNVKVLHDPADPDPSRRYKLGAHVWFPKNNVRLGTFAPYVSGDGFTWKLLGSAKPVDAELPEDKTFIPPLHFEPVGGLYKWDGLFHLSGQNAIAATRPYHGRVSRTFISSDFVHWSQSSAIQFVRHQQHRLLGPGKSRAGEQTHEGISVWNRGNVLVGISGMWHGAPAWKDVTTDLGFVVSNDGIHFREPAHEHVFLKRGLDGQWDQGGLLQGQGFQNIDNATCFYYGAWDHRNWENAPPRGGVGIATLPRDRFASLVVDKTTEGAGNYQMAQTTSEFITIAVPLDGARRRFYVNASGLSERATLKLELLSPALEPLPAYSGQNAALVNTNGFQTPVSWNGASAVSDLPQRIRVKMTFLGTDKSQVRFHALYIR